MQQQHAPLALRVGDHLDARERDAEAAHGARARDEVGEREHAVGGGDDRVRLAVPRVPPEARADGAQVNAWRRGRGQLTDLRHVVEWRGEWRAATRGLMLMLILVR